MFYKDKLKSHENGKKKDYGIMESKEEKKCEAGRISQEQKMSQERYERLLMPFYYLASKRNLAEIQPSTMKSKKHQMFHDLPY